MVQNLRLITKHGFIFTFIVLVFFGCNNKRNKESTLTLATYTYSTNDRVENLKPFANELEKILKRPVQIKSYSDVSSFINGIKANEVDIAFMNTLGYLVLSLDNKNMQPIAALKVRDDAVDNYKTVLLTNNEEIKNLNFLKDNAQKLSMTFVAKGSTSGNLVPRAFLNSIGIDSPKEQFKNVDYGGNHSTTFAKLQSGKTDICAIGSKEYYEQIESDSSLLQSTKILWISEEIPLGPVLVNNKIATIDKDKVVGLLLDLHKTNPEAFEQIKKGWSEAGQAEKFYPISDKYYNSFRKIDGNQTSLSQILDSFQD